MEAEDGKKAKVMVDLPTVNKLGSAPD